VVLGTLFVFATLVVLIHVLAVGHATGPLRLEGLRLAADAAARDLAEGRQPALALPFAHAIVGESGEVLAGRLPLRGFPRGEPSALVGERCGEWGYWCWAVRAAPRYGIGARLVVYPRFRRTPGFLGPISFALLGSVLAWLAVSAVAGLVLLRSLRNADDSRRRLLASLAHDLGTPLTSIRGFAETRLSAAAGSSTAGDEHRGWTVVYREALRMQRLIEDMLALTRVEAGRFAIVARPFDLREVLHSAAERAELAHGSGPRLDLPDAPAVAVADRDRIDQVLANLVDNAYRHGEGREVALRLEKAGADRWRITVADAGPGLAPEARAHLFEPFHTAGSGKGSGLGLAIAREIVARHGGSLRVEEAPGCRVVVELPAGGPS
jgi:signal transduction histidine kinase